MARIKPETLKGFRDFLPDRMLVREAMMETARGVFRRHGFAPIDTPALEKTDILLGKGGGETDKQLFRFTDNGGRDVAMRFDLTVPLARYASQHANDLGTPFKRYALGTVWRAEKPQKGRYREFVQCDFDTVGADSVLADAETLVTIFSLFRELGLPEITVRVNSRAVLNAILRKFEVEAISSDILRSIDKLPKIGVEKTLAELMGLGLTDETAGRLLQTLTAGDQAAVSTQAALESQQQGRLDAARVALDNVNLDLQAREQHGPLVPLILLRDELKADAEAVAAIDRLEATVTAAMEAGIEPKRIMLDLSIARGLDYYTGIIYETFLDALPGIGSVCSGGRYDNLADLFSSQPLPGVGASLGLDRLLAAMEELGLMNDLPSTPARVLVAILDTGHEADALRVASNLRASGLPTEVYPSVRAPKHVFKYADRKGFAAVVLAGSKEFEAGTWQVKRLSDGSQAEVADGQIGLHVAELLQPGPAVAS